MPTVFLPPTQIWWPSNSFRLWRPQRPTKTLPLPGCTSRYRRGSRRDGRGPELRTVHDSVAEERRSPWLGSLLVVDARLGLRRELRRGGARERWSQVGDSRLHCCPPSHCSSPEAPPVAGFVRRVCPQSCRPKWGLFGSTLQSIHRQATSFCSVTSCPLQEVELKSVKFWLLRRFIKFFQWIGDVGSLFFGYWIAGSIRIPRRDSVTFVSAIGHIDRRVDLFQGANLRQAIENFSGSGIQIDSKPVMDLCMMASKLAYENEHVVKQVIDHHWKASLLYFVLFMCFNQFYTFYTFIYTGRYSLAKDGSFRKKSPY